jgi:hypothetical protein
LEKESGVVSDAASHMAAQFYHQGMSPNENLFNHQIKLVPILEKFFNHNT